jgi:hypothetical protein
MVLLSGTLILLILGGSAHLAKHIRPGTNLRLWRIAYALLVIGGIGFWQWQVGRVSMTPFVEVANTVCDMSRNGYDDQSGGTDAQRCAVGISLLVPLLLVGLNAVISQFQRVPLATGLGRGLRGIAIPAAMVVFLLYALSLLPTAYTEAALDKTIARSVHNQPQYLTECCHKIWPGDPQP